MHQSPEMQPRFSVVIPAHNEEMRIERTLEEYAREFSDSEIIVVLNGCVDGTKAVVERTAANFSNLKLIEIEHAVGKGGAVRAGFLLAKAEVVAYADADGATPGPEMRRLCELLAPGLDAVIASRWMAGAQVSVRQPFKRRFASRCFNLAVRALFGLPFADTQCGAKVFRRDTLESVMPSIETSNLAFDVDLLFALRSQGKRIREVPTVWNDVNGSRVELLSASSKMLFSLLRLRLRNSFIRVAIPMFDKLFPTKPVPLHDGLRILILNWRCPKHPRAGGAEIYLHQIAKRWVEHGHRVEWLTASFPGAQKHDVIDGVRITRVGNRFTVYARVPLEYLRSFRDRFDLIVDSENGIPFFSPLFSLKPKLCLVYHVHRDVFRKHLPWPISEVFVWAESWLMPRIYRGSSFVTISEDTHREMTERKFSLRPIGIVHGGVDEQLVPGTKAPYPSIVYLGRLMPYKRVEVLIHAFAAVRARIPGAMLHIAGTGPSEPALRDLVATLNLRDAVLFEGFIDEDCKRELLQSAWVFCTPSEMEGWGLTVIEANACGTPAVAFAAPGLREAIVDGLSGLLVPEGGDLSAALTDVLESHEFRHGLERGALARASEFSWDEAARGLFEAGVHELVGVWFGLVRINKKWTLVRRRSGSESANLAALGTERTLIDVS